jgi:rubredoxin
MTWWLSLLFIGYAVAVVVTILTLLQLRRARRTRVERPAPAPKPTLDFPHVAPPILHLVDKLTGLPICGASVREPWTVLPETATCPECRRQGDMAMLQWFTTNR